VPPTEGRPLSRKTKNDASKTFDEWTKKKHETPTTTKMDIWSTRNNL
jgi:hypothetical protein